MQNYRSTPNSRQIPINVCGSSTFGRYPTISVERTYNMFLTDEWLVNFAGYRRVLDLLSSGEGRGLFHSVRGNFMIAVVNATVFRIDSNLNITMLTNTLSTSTGEVFVDENLNNQICIVDGVDAYIYNHNGAPTLVAQNITAGQSDLVPNYVAYNNTFFLFGNALTNNDGSKWFVYEPNAATTIQYVATLALQTKPDFALAVKRIPGAANNVMVFGSSVCEIWTQVSNAIEPYRRNSTLSVDYGCASVSTIAASDKSIFWLAINETNSPTIMMYTGGNASVISTDGIDYLLQTILYPNQSTAAIFRQDGHLFYMLTFFNPADNLTICYDATVDKILDLTDQHLNFHPAREIVYFNRTWYFVSLNRASLYEMSTDITVIDESLGEDPESANDFIYDMQFIRVCNTVRNEQTARFRGNTLVMTIEQGNDPNCTGPHEANYIVMEDDTSDVITSEIGVWLVTETSPSSDAFTGCPRVDLTVSRDGGYTWSQTVSKTLNPLGKRQNILNWQNMGAANQMTHKFRFWGGSRWVVNNAVMEVY